MSFLNYLVSNYELIYILIGLVILSVISVHLPEKMKSLTFLAVVLLILETVSFYLERWSQTFETLSVLRPMMTALTYSLYPLILIVITRMTAKKLIRLRFWLLMIPELICIPVFFSSQWTDIVFHFDEENHYHGGLVPNLPYILFGFYAVIFVISNIMYLKRYSRKHRLAVEYISLGSMVGIILYLVSHSEKDYSLLFAASILLYYTFMYIHMARIDPLTSMLNRQCFYKDMQSNDRSITGIVSVDMNYLKYYNDNLGHEAGDKALKTVSQIMMDNCGKGGTAYRVGGDEFVILYMNVSEADITDAISTMQEKMSETEYMCAFGYAMRKPFDSLYDKLKTSDEMMYLNKALIKKEYPIEKLIKNKETFKK